MPKQQPPKDTKKPRSKAVDTSIVLAALALIGTLATAFFNSPVILEWLKHRPAPSAASAQVQPPSNPPGNSSSNSSSQMPAASVPSGSGGNGSCLAQQFADIAPDRQMSMEAGATSQDYFFIGEDLAKNDFIGPIGVRLTQNGQPIAGLSFLFFVQSQMFKITSFVDSNCQPVTDYSNASRGGDHNSLQESDTLKIQLAEGLFSMRFTYRAPEAVRLSFLSLP
jgi:hypothetical protein